jgi:glutamate N-acetyltransferase/amino-acid N-acetyltransferase
MDESSGVTYAKGFTAAGVACGIKKNGDRDLAIIKCEVAANAAGVFTRNIVKGHSLQLARENIANGRAQLVIVNAGNANACLAERGRQDALLMAKLAADAFNCDPENVLTASTGVIGVPLPMDKIEAGIEKAALSRGGGSEAAQAIMTTDTVMKQAQASADIEGKTIRIGGMAKGSGMIHPDMATMIAIITTDACISADALKSALKTAADKSFNRISVDGDTSVCDKALIMASGFAGNDEIHEGTEGYNLFLKALEEVCVKLAKMLASDGEGATKLLAIRVNGARTDSDAHLIACAIAKSPLCKTAAFGCDANWGRLLTAAGNSGAAFDPEKVDIYIGSVQVCRNGGGLEFDEGLAYKELDRDEVTYTLELGEGGGRDVMWTCDFSFDYIKINAEYRT